MSISAWVAGTPVSFSAMAAAVSAAMPRTSPMALSREAWMRASAAASFSPSSASCAAWRSVASAVERALASAAVRPALEAAARTFGPVVLDPGQLMEPTVALSAIAAKADAVAVPLLDGGVVHAVIALALNPWPVDTPPTGMASRGDSPAVIRSGLDMLHDVEMEVSAELGRTRMSVRELLSLSPGAIVELDRAAGSPADLLVNGRLIARGEVVVVDENFGIRITEIVSPGSERE